MNTGNRTRTELMMASLGSALILSVAAFADGLNNCAQPKPLPVNDGDEVVSFKSLHHSPGAIDPVLFFQQLVERYRTIGAYEDQTHVVEVTTPDGGTAQRRETDLRCEITAAGELIIKTPGAALLHDFGVQLPFMGSMRTSESRRAFDLWQAPHLGLRFMKNPLHDFRVGVSDGFTATRARPVKIGTRELVQLELAGNADHDGQAETAFDLFVDPQSMLVERIEGVEHLPDGARYETTLEIELRDVRDLDGVVISRAVQDQDETQTFCDAPTGGWSDIPPGVSPTTEDADVDDSIDGPDETDVSPQIPASSPPVEDDPPPAEPTEQSGGAPVTGPQNYLVGPR